MSLEARKWAEKKCGIGPADRWVLWWLADHLNDNTGRCNPSRTTLADEVGVDVKTVQRATERLRECGLIDWTTRRNPNGTNLTNAYTLNLDNRAYEQTPQPNESGRVNLTTGDQPKADQWTFSPSTSGHFVHPPVDRMSNEPIKKEPIKKEPMRSALPHAAPDVNFSNSDSDGKTAERDDLKERAFADLHAMLPGISDSMDLRLSTSPPRTTRSVREG